MKKKILSLYVDEDFYDRVQKVAQADRRSVSQILRFYIEAGVKKFEKKKEGVEDELRNRAV